MRNLMESGFAGTLRLGAMAGAAGGLAEVAWIAIYGAATGTPTEPVARGVAATLIPALAASSWSAPIGIVIHLALAVVLGLALAAAVQLFAHHDSASHSRFGLVMLSLAGVWAVNFLFALPHLNPEFVRLLPYEVTLLSKLLFGIAAAIVLVTPRGNEWETLDRTPSARAGTSVRQNEWTDLPKPGATFARWCRSALGRCNDLCHR
jgi:hypothetical protein